MTLPKDYLALLGDIKARIQGAQLRAALAANRELLRLYWDIGDLASDLPEVKGFSERNLKRMIRFFREYPTLCEKVPQPVAQLERGPDEVLLALPWGHLLSESRPLNGEGAE